MKRNISVVWTIPGAALGVLLALSALSCGSAPPVEEIEELAVKYTLAILPFSGGEREDGETIAELFSFDPTLNKVFAPMPRTSINRAISREQNFQLGGMTDPDTIIAIGKQLGAQYIVAGNITRLGQHKLLVISIIRILRPLKLCRVCPNSAWLRGKARYTPMAGMTDEEYGHEELKKV
jgi:TolB-like protein